MIQRFQDYIGKLICSTTLLEWNYLFDDKTGRPRHNFDLWSEDLQSIFWPCLNHYHVQELPSNIPMHAYFCQALPHFVAILLGISGLDIEGLWRSNFLQMHFRAWRLWFLEYLRFLALCIFRHLVVRYRYFGWALSVRLRVFQMSCRKCEPNRLTNQAIFKVPSNPLS